MWEKKKTSAINVRKTEFIKSINLRWKWRISARNADYEIKKLQRYRQGDRISSGFVEMHLHKTLKIHNTLNYLCINVMQKLKSYNFFLSVRWPPNARLSPDPQPPPAGGLSARRPRSARAAGLRWKTICHGASCASTGDAPWVPFSKPRALGHRGRNRVSEKNVAKENRN
jgi:hypothetical protein